MNHIIIEIEVLVTSFSCTILVPQEPAKKKSSVIKSNHANSSCNRKHIATASECTQTACTSGKPARRTFGRFIMKLSFIVTFNN